MIVVEYDDTQYGDVMHHIECIKELATKIAHKTKALEQMVGDNSMSMRGRKYDNDELYNERRMSHREYEDPKYNNRYY